MNKMIAMLCIISTIGMSTISLGMHTKKQKTHSLNKKPGLEYIVSKLFPEKIKNCYENQITKLQKKFEYDLTKEINYYSTIKKNIPKNIPCIDEFNNKIIDLGLKYFKNNEEKLLSTTEKYIVNKFHLTIKEKNRYLNEYTNDFVSLCKKIKTKSIKCFWRSTVPEKFQTTPVTVKINLRKHKRNVLNIRESKKFSGLFKSQKEFDEYYLESLNILGKTTGIN